MNEYPIKDNLNMFQRISTLTLIQHMRRFTVSIDQRRRREKKKNKPSLWPWQLPYTPVWTNERNAISNERHKMHLIGFESSERVKKKKG